jgi:hypothetical protein
MIMSIPVLNKIKVLSQISSPLPAPGLTSPKPEVRGAIIAIDGMDATTVNSMTNSLAEQLEKEGKFAVKIFGGPDPYANIRQVRNGAAGRHSSMTADAYLSMLSEWHKINKEMVDYISTRPDGVTSRTASASKPSPRHNPDHPMTGLMDEPKTPDKNVRMHRGQVMNDDSEISPKMMGKTAELSIVSPPARGRSQSASGLSAYASKNGPAEYNFQPPPPPMSFPRPLHSSRIPPPPPTPPAVPTPPPPPTPQTSSRLTHPTSASAWSEQQKSHEKVTLTRPGSSAIPIALVPHFQLTTVDASSISMPISDGFSPPAHWQWFATLWRGSIGPDITIVIKGLDDDNIEVAEASRASISNAAGTPVAGRERSSTAGLSSTGSQAGVDIRLNDCRALIVKTGIVGSSARSTSPQSSSPSVTANGGPKSSTTHAPVFHSAQQHAKEMENWEKAKRRVGFEVEEFLRR